MGDIRPRLDPGEYARLKDLKKADNVLVVGDLHAPFIKEGYFEHCVETYQRFYCNEVVFIGDIIDNHYSSYHETDPDGYGAGEELERAIDALNEWKGYFSKATVLLGNHDLLVQRKAYTAGLSKRWIREYNEVLLAPGWKFVEEYEKDNVLYVHGTGRKCRQRAKADLISTVQGHYHSDFYCDFFVGKKYKIFAMQVGCGVDQKAYAMAYGKAGPRMAIGCAVVLDSGRLPVLCPMEL